MRHAVIAFRQFAGTSFKAILANGSNGAVVEVLPPQRRSQYCRRPAAAVTGTGAHMRTLQRHCSCVQSVNDARSCFVHASQPQHRLLYRGQICRHTCYFVVFSAAAVAAHLVQGCSTLVAVSVPRGSGKVVGPNAGASERCLWRTRCHSGDSDSALHCQPARCNDSGCHSILRISALLPLAQNAPAHGAGWRPPSGRPPRTVDQWTPQPPRPAVGVPELWPGGSAVEHPSMSQLEHNSRPAAHAVRLAGGSRCCEDPRLPMKDLRTASPLRQTPR